MKARPNMINAFFRRVFGNPELPRVLIERSKDGVVTYDADPGVNVLYIDYRIDSELPSEWKKWLSAKYTD